ncbi:hypothetical protein QFZ66_005925 [Streptomyces sp. B4I13]|uniref:hypothetical protein n=1 Tax=Streptomyces sp. B4I13 TaxID=3042271 RepID=UPI002788AA33|nr:hypothetical protein [Streptomyces sp. B4I13]MDQ0962047.1 hypothetical protein [Streptomyces sp. B4I13]
MAVGGNFTNCNCGPEAQACESPTQPVATVGLCLADGTPIAVTIVRDCAGAITSEGWINLVTGQYTADPAPADAGACDAGCVDTLCRQLCDDTDGDGQADATYSELWCIKADGAAELVLTYQDDPSTPYTPVAPVDCTYGCAETETLTLCDASGPFLRRYTWLQDVATFQDYALDGSTPHVVTGTVGACAGGGGSGAAPCAEQTTPAATLGLCLADGTPIAVVITRDCATDTVTQDGWLNLLTGAYSAGAPPAGAAACGDSRAFELSGLLCDVLPDGTVAGLVLVEYAYNADGSLASVRLVDPATGGTYTLQGELNVCPGSGSPAGADLDLIVLCDVQADGTATPFLRDYRRDPDTELISGHTDYGLDGTPYTVTGTVGQCTPEAELCRNTSTLLVCDLPSGGEPTPTVSDTNPTPYQGTGLGAEPLPGGAAALWAGGAISIPADTGPGPDHVNQHLRSIAATLQAERPGCDTGTATITASIRVQRTGPSSALGGNGIWSLWSGGNRVALVTTPNNAPVGYTGTLTVSGQVPAADVAAGNVHLAGALETWQTAAHVGGWIVDQFTARVVYDQTGCETQFLRSVATDCETGAVVSVTDTTLDGTPYEPTGEVGQCTAAGGGQCCPQEPCRNSSALLLCDLPTDGAPSPTVTDTPGGPYYPYGTGVATAGAQALWDGGTLTLPDAAGPQPGTGGTVRTAAAIIQAPRPVCDAGTAHVTVQVDVAQLGPDDGCRATGFLGLYNGPGDANRVGLALAPPNTPAGWTGTLTAEADVPAADLAAGNIVVLVAFDAYDDSGAACPPPRRTGWQLSQFDATVVYDQTGCAAQFLRSVTNDCETGAVVSVTDTTLDGTPYTVTGEAGQCTAAGGGSCCPADPCPAQNVIEACRCDDTDGDGVGDADYVELLAVDCTGALTSLGTYTADLSAPYTPVAPVDCEEGAAGADSAFGVQARRVELAAGSSWTATAWPTLQSVTAAAYDGTGTITTADGPSTLHGGETVTWSLTRDEDARLTGPLTIAAGTGTVTVTFTIGVML